MRLRSVLLAVVAVTVLLPAGLAVTTLEKPELRAGEYWTFTSVGPDGDPRPRSGPVHVQVEAGGQGGWALVTETNFTRVLPNGSIEEETRTGSHVGALDLGVTRRVTVHVRDGVFDGENVSSYTRNVTRYSEPLPLLPAPSSPGDTWRTTTTASWTVNQTSRFGEGNDTRTVESGPTTGNRSVTEVLDVVDVETVETPAGTFNATVVNRTRDTVPGYTLEWWAPEPEYMVRWVRHAPDGTPVGGAVLADWGYDPPPASDDGIDGWVVAVGVAAVAALAAGAYVVRRR